MEQPTLPLQPRPAPDPPELPEGADAAPRWPAWYAPVAFLIAFALTIVAVVLIGAIAAAAGADVDDDSSVLVIFGTLGQAVVLVGTAVYFASLKAAPRAWHFGLRRTRFWPAVGWAALGMVSFYVFAATYVSVFEPKGEQSVVEDLGADESMLALVVAAFVVIVVAPVAEEFFFRGFFYRALRTRFGVLPAAGIAGGVFGIIHFTGPDTLSLLPMLGVLGFMFCLVYERTGSLYPVIGLHALNNTVAFSAQADGGEAVSLVMGAAMLVACAVVPRVAGGAGARAAPALR
jgi:membrane protease YdiL (CAAX protease family)